MKWLTPFLILVFSATFARAQTATITASTNTLSSSGGEVTFTVTITYTGQMASVGFEVGSVPANWTFGASGGANRPDLSPSRGTTSKFEFAYFSIPPSPITFTFTANYAAGLTGNQVFSGVVALLRADGGGALQTVRLNDVTLTGASVDPGPGPGPGPSVAPAIVAQPVGATINEGGTLTLSVLATGTAPLTYQWRKDGTSLAGATGASLALSAVGAANAGSYSVVVTNSAGTVTSSAAAVQVNAVVAPPVILSQPAAQTVAAGGTATFSVTASGPGTLSYQWSKGGAAVPGATSATLTVSNATAATAGSYQVAVTNAGGTVRSNEALLTVSGNATTAPTIVSGPAGKNAFIGETVTFTVTATGTAPLSYQWRKDGTPLSGGTAATLTLPAVAVAAAGDYSVAISNSAGTVTSAAARLTVSALPAGSAPAGAYFGAVSGGGSFALLLRNDRSVVFVGRAGALALVSREGSLDTAGGLQITATAVAGGAPLSTDGRAAAAGDYQITGTVNASGVSASLASTGAQFTAPAAVTNGTAASGVGYYAGGALNSSASSHLIVGAGGDAYVLTVNGTTADAGLGKIDPRNGVEIRTERGAIVTGTLTTSSATATLISTVPGGSPTFFFAANNAVRPEFEKLVNISTRSPVGVGSDLIAGFVVNGDAPKTVLVRAVGPSLSGFGVFNALSAARLQVFRGATVIASGDDWGKAANAAEIASTAARVGAFPFGSNSRDAALLLSLEPGAYTAAVSGQGGAAGVSLIEVYDATEGTTLASRRIVNISTRANAGTGDSTLIAGFVINGVVPKRVLVRGAGPALTQFGVTGVLARPRLAVFSGADQLAENTGWSTSTDAAAIVDASAGAGAFAFPAAGADSAILIYLSPGAYTAQVSGVGGTTGVALLEIYEVP